MKVASRDKAQNNVLKIREQRIGNRQTWQQQTVHCELVKHHSSLLQCFNIHVLNMFQNNKQLQKQQIGNKNHLRITEIVCVLKQQFQQMKMYATGLLYITYSIQSNSFVLWKSNANFSLIEGTENVLQRGLFKVLSHIRNSTIFVRGFNKLSSQKD